MTRARDLADLAGAADAGTVAGTNLIINGDMAVWQRGTAATTVSGAGVYDTVDRFKLFESTDGAFTSERSTTVPSGEGFGYSLKLAVTTADTSLGTTQYACFAPVIEAQNLQHLDYGTSNAKDVTLSFWVRSSKTGTYSIALEKTDSTLYRYIKEYSINTADTWEKKTITIKPDSQIKASAGAIANDNGAGFFVFFNLAWGSNWNGGTDGAWSSDANDYATSNQVNWMDSTSNDFYITGVKLEVGSTATPFLHESYAENLAKCQRYFQKDWYKGGGAISVGHAWAATRAMADISFSGGQMRTSPTITLPTAGQGANVMTFLNSGSAYPTTTGTHSVQGVSNINFRLDATGYAGLTTGSASWLYSGSSLGNVYFEYDFGYCISMFNQFYVFIKIHKFRYIANKLKSQFPPFLYLKKPPFTLKGESKLFV